MWRPIVVPMPGLLGIRVLPSYRKSGCIIYSPTPRSCRVLVLPWGYWFASEGRETHLSYGKERIVALMPSSMLLALGVGSLLGRRWPPFFPICYYRQLRFFGLRRLYGFRHFCHLAPHVRFPPGQFEVWALGPTAGCLPQEVCPIDGRVAASYFLFNSHLPIGIGPLE